MTDDSANSEGRGDPGSEPILVGREAELERAGRLLFGSKPALLLVSGPRGVGKTAFLKRLSYLSRQGAVPRRLLPGADDGQWLKITPDTDADSFCHMLDSLVTGRKSSAFDMILDDFPMDEGQHSTRSSNSSQAPRTPDLLPLNGMGPVLLLLDGFRPSSGFADWFLNRFMAELRSASAPVVIAAAEISWDPPFEAAADERIQLEPLSPESLTGYFGFLGQQMVPEANEQEIEIYVEASRQKLELIEPLTRLLKLTVPSHV